MKIGSCKGLQLNQTKLSGSTQTYRTKQ